MAAFVSVQIAEVAMLIASGIKRLNQLDRSLDQEPLHIVAVD